MASMLGNRCSNTVKVAFKELPSTPELSTDPLAQHVPFEELYLQRMRELDMAHSLLYTMNIEYTENLSGRLQAVTELVYGSIIRVLGDTESVAAAECWKMLGIFPAAPVKHPGVIHVCKEDPNVHDGLPKCVWETPELDEAFLEVAALNGWKTIADFEEGLLYRHINRMLKPAIAAQQHIIRCLVNVLSEQPVITHLHKILRHHRVPEKTITRICAEVVGLQCHWTTEIPANWLSEPVQARTSGQHQSCVVVEEPNCSSNNTANNTNNTNNSNKNNTSNKNNHNNNSKGWRLFSVRLGKAVAAAGVTVASMLAIRHGAGALCAVHEDCMAQVLFLIICP